MKQIGNVDIPILSQFHSVSENEAEKIIRKCNTVSSELDPIPNFLLKQCLPERFPVITKIVNLSFEEQNVSPLYKKAAIRALMKKHSLDL